MFTELMECRELITRLAMRDFSAKYRQSVLGYIWAVMIPVIAIGTFMLLNRAGVLAIGKTDAPYPLFALIGLSVWQLFSSGIISGTNSLVTAGSMIGKINFPRETLVIAAMTQPVFEFMIKSVLICVLFVYFGFTPHWQIVFSPPL